LNRVAAAFDWRAAFPFGTGLEDTITETPLIRASGRCYLRSSQAIENCRFVGVGYQAAMGLVEVELQPAGQVLEAKDRLTFRANG